MLREQNCFLAIFLPWSFSFGNIVKIIHGKVRAVPFHVGLIMLPKKQTKKPHTDDIILASPVIAGHPGPLSFSLPVTTIGSSFTGQRRKRKICGSYNNTTLARLNSIASRWGNRFDAARHFYKNTRWLTVMGFVVPFFSCSETRTVPGACNEFSPAWFSSPETTPAQTTAADTRLASPLDHSDRGVGVPGCLQRVKSRRDAPAVSSVGSVPCLDNM